MIATYLSTHATRQAQRRGVRLDTVDLILAIRDNVVLTVEHTTARRYWA